MNGDAYLMVWQLLHRGRKRPELAETPSASDSGRSNNNNRCNECNTSLPSDAKFCSNCGTQVGIEKDVYNVSGEGLVGKVKEIINDARVKRINIKDDRGKLLLSIPVTWGAAGAVAVLALAPWLAALGVIAGIVTKCTVEVEKIRE
jgi:ribosomal protein L40E